MKKKVISLFVTGMLAVSMIAGCGSDNTADTSTSADTTADAAADTPDGITHDTIAVKSIISWEGEKKWLLATRWDITQLKNYERELVAAKEELEKSRTRRIRGISLVSLWAIR